MTPAESAALAREVSLYYDDPLGYVTDLYDWGQGDLAHSTGPDTWQTEALLQIGEEVKRRNFDGHTPVPPLRFTRASGHDCGKTTLAAWLVNWIKDTRPNSVGTVTANTFSQLETKTWAAITRWAKLAPTRDWWEMGAAKMWHRGDPDKRETWFVECKSSSDENSEAFAGQHARYSTSYYVFDEASAISEGVWPVAEGGLVDGEPMFFAFGNPTRNTGRFYEANFGNQRHRWNHGSIDSRTSGISNKTTIDEWLQDYGEESDFFRVRVRGLPPQQAENQLIGRELVEGAQKRRIDPPLPDEPLIAGVDVPDGGSAWFVVRFRRGLDARSIPPIRVPGSKIDRPGMLAQLAALMRDGVDGRPIAAMFIDSAFGAALVERLHTLGFSRVHEVNFGNVKTPDTHYYNMRSFMYGKKAKDWLARGAIDPADTKLAIDLTGPGWHFNAKDQLLLESKADMRKRGQPSCDDSDSFVLTFAHDVAPERRVSAPQPLGQAGYESGLSWLGA